MNPYAQELADTIEAHQLRKRPKTTPIAPAARRAQVKIADETYRRVRSACSPFSVIPDLDDHAARVTLDVHRARAWPRHPTGD